jgi:hypothetical protein
VIPIESPKNILAIGGPRHLEMLPYIGAQEYLVPVLRSVKFSIANEIVSTHPVQPFKYYLQQLGTESARKLVYVGEDLMSMNKATDLLKEALLEMWIQQPYKDDPPF